MFLRTRLVTKEEWRVADAHTGSIYFIRNAAADTIKIGHSRDVTRRLQELQVGNSARLELIGVIAAEIAIEKVVHFQLMEGRVTGEWFYDRGVTTQWLSDMTSGEPMFRNIWDFVRGREWLSIWHEDTQSHTKHYWNEALKQWEPPLK
jgi:hypothetical protein